MNFSEEDIVDILNHIISAQATSKRVIVWNVRHIKELKKLESWLKYEQSKLHPKQDQAPLNDD